MKNQLRIPVLQQENSRSLVSTSPLLLLFKAILKLNIADLVASGVLPRTHCPKKHEYTPENTRWGNIHGRKAKCCRTCERARATKNNQRLAERRMNDPEWAEARRRNERERSAGRKRKSA